MKILSLIMNRKKETFEFYSVKNLEMEEITNVSEFITCVEQENARLLEKGERGSVVAVKKNHKGTILFATKIELPVSLTTDFDEYLYDFYTNKPVSFDQSILNMEETIEESTFSNPEEADYAPVPEIEDSPLEPSEKEHSILEKTSYDKQANNQIETLDQSNADSNLQTPEMIASIPETKHSESVSESLTRETLSSEMSKPTVVEREIIEQPVSFTVNTFEQRLKEFIDQEMKNIQDEIQLIDKRNLIEKEITTTVQQEEERMLKLIDQTLSDQRSKAIEEENLRHQKELEAIDRHFDQETQKQRMEAIKEYEEEAKKRIAEEYQRQTKEIEQIIQLRLTTFQDRQSKLGGNIEKNLEEFLDKIRQDQTTSNQNTKQLKQTKKDPPS